MNLYNDDVQRIIKTAVFPKGFTYDIMEFPFADPPQLKLYVYKDNIAMFPDSVIDSKIAPELKRVLREIQKLGVVILIEDLGDKYV